MSKFFVTSLFLSFQQNYFDGSTKLFSNLYPAKFYISQQNRSFHVSKYK